MKVVNKKRLIVAICIVASLIIAAVSCYFIDRAIKEAEYKPLDAEEISAALERNVVHGQRKQLVEAGVSLVGKVNYFWGGKSNAIGWDENWGVMMEVTSAGSKSSGTYEPFGLDCSGFVSWCFLQIGMEPREMEKHIGHGTWKQWEKSYEISFAEAQPGDLFFQNKNGEGNGNHVGICIGRNERGTPLIVHCAAGFDNVVVTTPGLVFRYARRPGIF